MKSFFNEMFVEIEKKIIRGERDLALQELEKVNPETIVDEKSKYQFYLLKARIFSSKGEFEKANNILIKLMNHSR